MPDEEGRARARERRGRDRWMDGRLDGWMEEEEEEEEAVGRLARTESEDEFCHATHSDGQQGGR